MRFRRERFVLCRRPKSQRRLDGTQRSGRTTCDRKYFSERLLLLRHCRRKRFQHRGFIADVHFLANVDFVRRRLDQLLVWRIERYKLSRISRPYRLRVGENDRR